MHFATGRAGDLFGSGTKIIPCSTCGICFLRVRERTEAILAPRRSGVKIWSYNRKRASDP